MLASSKQLFESNKTDFNHYCTTWKGRSLFRPNQWWRGISCKCHGQGIIWGRESIFCRVYFINSHIHKFYIWRIIYFFPKNLVSVLVCSNFDAVFCNLIRYEMMKNFFNLFLFNSNLKQSKGTKFSNLHSHNQHKKMKVLSFTNGNMREQNAT